MRAQRDLAGEQAQMAAVLDACLVLDDAGLSSGWVLEDPEQALELVEALPTLSAVAGIDWPRGKPITLTRTATGALHVRIRCAAEWFELQGGIHVEALVVDLQRLLQCGSPQRGRFVPLADGKYLALTKRVGRDPCICTASDMHESRPTLNFDQTLKSLVDSFGQLIREARQQALRAVDTLQVQTCWQIGSYIVEFEQGGEARAAYGKRLLQELAAALTTEYGKGFDASNLRYMRLFYQAFPMCDALRHELSWTHYRTLLRVDSTAARQWYMVEAAPRAGAPELWSGRSARATTSGCLPVRGLAGIRAKIGQKHSILLLYMKILLSVVEGSLTISPAGLEFPVRQLVGCLSQPGQHKNISGLRFLRVLFQPNQQIDTSILLVDALALADEVNGPTPQWLKKRVFRI